MWKERGRVCVCVCVRERERDREGQAGIFKVRIGLEEIEGRH